GVEDALLIASRVNDDLGAGAKAGLQRAHSVQRELALGVAQQRRIGTEQCPIKVHVQAAHGGRDRSSHTQVQMSVARDTEPWEALLQTGREDERLGPESRPPAPEPPPGFGPAELGPAGPDALGYAGPKHPAYQPATQAHAPF